MVTGDSGQVLELSAGQGSALGGAGTTNPAGQPISEGLRVKFKSYAADFDAPNHCEIVIYNLSDATATRVIKEFSRVILQAGYVNGRFGVIFTGTLKQFKRGRESSTDTYLILYAADGDFLHNNWIIGGDARTPIEMPRGSTQAQRFQALQADAVKNGGALPGNVGATDLAGTGGVILGRTKMMFGLGADHFDTTSKPGFQWSVQGGRIQTVPLNSSLPGEAVVLNAHSGLIGVPEANNQGVFATALLNPSIKVRGQVKINNAGINTSEPAVAATQVKELGYPGYTDINFFASTSADGTYTVLTVEYSGDTRGNEWYVHLGMLLLDPGTNKAVPDQTTKLPPAQGDVTIEDIQLPPGVS